MTSRRRIESALRAGPPDEPVYPGGLADRLGGPQSESRPGTPLPSPTPMSLTADPRTPARRRWVQIAAISTAAAGIVAIALFANGRDRSPDPAVANPTVPVTTPSIPATTEPAALALDGRWVGPPEASADSSQSPAARFLVFEHDSVALEHQVGGIVSDFVSDTTDVTDSRFRITLVGQVGGCAPDAVGDYTWARSAGGSTLTIEVVDDQCAERGAAFDGTWTLIGCAVRGTDCLGPLESGRHTSVSFDPFGAGSYGQIAYTVPQHWASPLDDRARLALQPISTDNGVRHGIYFFADAAAPADACTSAPDSAVGADAIAAALSESLDSANATTSVEPSTVGGLDARVVDITTGATSPCADPVRVLIARPDSTIDWNVTTRPSQQLRLVLVDLPGGRTMAIVVASDRSDEEYSALLEAASTLIDSITFSSTP